MSGNLDIPRAGRGGTARGGAAGRCRARQDDDGTVFPGNKHFSCPPITCRALKTRVLNVASEARTSEFSFVEPKTQTYHGRVGTGRRTAGRRSGAGTGSTGRRWDGSPRIQPSLVPSRRSKKTSWACLWKNEQRKSYVNRRGNKTRG